MHKFITLLIVAILLACGGTQQAEEAAQVEEVAATLAPLDQAEDAAASAEVEEPAEEATATPAPTNTLEPTATPEPTPDLSFEPIELSGSGDSVVNVDKPDLPAIIEITGNSEAGFFAVESINDNGETLALLVNTTDPYSGIRGLDFDDDDLTTRLQISASGDWSATIRPLTDAKRLNVPGSISGANDDVILLEGATPDIATISGNQDSRFFGVIGYGTGFPSLLVNTTDPYQGQTIVESDVVVLEIQAVGDWSIELSGK